MQLFYLLLLVEVVFILLNYYIQLEDVIAPSTMASIVVFCGSLIALYGAKKWETEIYPETIFIFLLGELSIFLAGMFSIIFRKKGYVDKKICKSIIHFGNKKEIVIMIISLALTFLYIVESIRVGLLLGGTGLRAFAYTKAAYMRGVFDYRMNLFIRQGFKVVMSLSYIAIFLFINNCFICQDNIKSNIAFLVVILDGCIITIASASRTEILRLFSAALLVFSVLYRDTKNWKKRSNERFLSKLLKLGIPISILIVVIAYFSKSIVKEEYVLTSEIDSLIDYLIFYVGSPVAVLNEKVHLKFSFQNILWGNKTEVNDFIYLGELNYGGNVGTIFDSCIWLNGAIKMMLFLFIVFFLSNVVYYNFLYKSVYGKRRNKNLILISYFYFIIVMSYYSNCFRIIFNRSNLFTFIVLLFSVFVIFDVKVKFHR